MKKEELKAILEEYWYDSQYLKEKTKEIETVNQLIKYSKPLNVIKQIKTHEENVVLRIINKKEYVEKLFQKLLQPYRTLMYLKYISFLTFDQIADRMKYSTKRIYQLHAEALNKLLEIIDTN